MKFTVTMKDPDTLWDSITGAVQDQIDTNLPKDEARALQEIRQDKVREVCSKWFRYGEYLTVEIDTDAGTCIVLEEK